MRPGRRPLAAKRLRFSPQRKSPYPANEPPAAKARTLVSGSTKPRCQHTTAHRYALMREVAASGGLSGRFGALRRQGMRGISAEYVRFETGRLGILARRGRGRKAPCPACMSSRRNCAPKGEGGFPDFLMRGDVFRVFPRNFPARLVSCSGLCYNRCRILPKGGEQAKG